MTGQESTAEIITQYFHKCDAIFGRIIEIDIIASGHAQIGKVDKILRRLHSRLSMRLQPKYRQWQSHLTNRRHQLANRQLLCKR